LLEHGNPVLVPLAGNAKSLNSLRIRIGDALKFFADTRGEPFIKLKRRFRFKIESNGECLKLYLRTGIQFKIEEPPKETLEPEFHEALATKLIAFVKDESRDFETRRKFANYLLSMRPSEDQKERFEWTGFAALAKTLA
jgi:hypothetical protein